MIDAAGVLENLNRRGVRLTPNPPKLVAEPSSLLTDEDRQAIRTHKSELLALLAPRHPEPYDLREREEDQIDRLAQADGWESLPEPGSPAYSIVETCQLHGVALRIDDDGDLVVGKAGAKASEDSQPWPRLIAALEAHLEAVARLVETGWTMRGEFPKQAAG